MSRGGLRSCVRIPRYRPKLRDELMEHLNYPPLLIPVVTCCPLFLSIFYLLIIISVKFKAICPSPSFNTS